MLSSYGSIRALKKLSFILVGTDLGRLLGELSKAVIGCEEIILIEGYHLHIDLLMGA
jgi:hypothetical protein